MDVWKATKAASDQGFSDHEGGAGKLPVELRTTKAVLASCLLGCEGTRACAGEPSGDLPNARIGQESCQS
jgi:hypothetical protein